MRGDIKKLFLFISLIVILLIVKNYSFSQTKPEVEQPRIRFGEISFKLRQIESMPSNIKFLEIHIEILNLSKKVTLPENSIKLVIIPKEVSFKDNSSDAEWQINKEERFLDFPIPPLAGRIVVFGFSLPENIPQSITFDIQINPPDGEKKTITWREK